MLARKATPLWWVNPLTMLAPSLPPLGANEKRKWRHVKNRRYYLMTIKFNKKEGTESVEADTVAELPGTEKQPLQKKYILEFRIKHWDEFNYLFGRSGKRNISSTLLLLREGSAKDDNANFELCAENLEIAWLLLRKNQSKQPNIDNHECHLPQGTKSADPRKIMLCCTSLWRVRRHANAKDWLTPALESLAMTIEYRNETVVIERSEYF